MQPFDALDDRLIRGAPSSLFGPVAFQFVQTETVPPVPPLFLLFRAAFAVLNDRRMTTSGSWRCRTGGWRAWAVCPSPPI